MVKWDSLEKDRTSLFCRRSCQTARHCSIEHTLARRETEHLWNLLNEEEYINALGMKDGTLEFKKITDPTITTTSQKKLLPEICVDCGQQVEEEYKSYFTKCDHCLNKENE